MPLENFITSVSACSSRPVSRRTSLILCAHSLRGTSSRAAKKSRFSRAERRGKNERSAATATPTCRRTAPASRRASKPPTRTDPASGRSMVEISLRAVVLPLPFGPSSTRTSALAAEKETSLKAIVSPPRSFPSQLNRAGRWRKVLRTDSKTTLSMAVRTTKARTKLRFARRRLCIIVAIRNSIDSGLRPLVYPSESACMTKPLPSSPVSNGSLQIGHEFELLCALAGVDLAPERIERIANWDLSKLDWSEVLRLAEQHGVLPLAARNLIEHAHGLPPEVERSLQSAYEANLRRSLWFSAELARILQQFERRQVRALPYKGPVLAQSAYGDLGLRSYSDLDFLIAPADFVRAKQALGEIGYRPSTDLTAPVERFFLWTGYERSFDSAAGKNLVELQWALLPHFYGVDV